MSTDLDFVQVVDGIIRDIHRAGLPPLPLLITEAFVQIYTAGMAEEKRRKLAIEILVTVSHRVSVFQKQHAAQSQYVS
jgi:hypothetical protein